jgi:hypothetical protein
MTPLTVGLCLNQVATKCTTTLYQHKDNNQMAQQRLTKSQRKLVKQLRDNKRNKKSAWDNVEVMEDNQSLNMCFQRMSFN